MGKFTVRPGKGGQHWESWMQTDGLDSKLVGIYSSFESAVLSTHEFHKESAKRSTRKKEEP